MHIRRTVALLALTLTAAVPAAAHAAAPPNDTRTDAQSLNPLPAAVNGTTIDATKQSDEFGSNCGSPAGSVWYVATAAKTGRVVVTATAHGDLDIVVDVYKKVRSTLTGLNCDASDSKGDAATDFSATQGTQYLIRVAQRTGSVPGAFDLHVSAPVAAARPPGRLLAGAGITKSLDRIENPDDAWSFRFHAGTSYRIHLSGRKGHCTTHAIVFAPGTDSFSDEDSEVTELSCDEYRLVTPGPGQAGRYSIRVLADRSHRGPQPYHLQVAPAGPDDTAPGLPLHTGTHVHGALAGGHIDLIDLYRFTVSKRSVTYLRLSGGNDLFMQLLSQHGRRIASDEGSIRARIRPGHYFVAVRADGNGGGRYTLSRIERLITSTRTSLTGGAGGLTANVTTSPAAGGRWEITFERFDPLAGWLFAKSVHVSGHGNVSASYDPPGPGQYRAKAVYLGSKAASGSHSGFSYHEIADTGDGR